LNLVRAEAHTLVMEALNVFSFACLMFGLLCAAFALVLDHQERRRIYAAAVLRRVYCEPGRKLIFQEDGKPLCYEDDEA
jgi:hypothetical protein